MAYLQDLVLITTYLRRVSGIITTYFHYLVISWWLNLNAGLKLVHNTSLEIAKISCLASLPGESSPQAACEAVSQVDDMGLWDGGTQRDGPIWLRCGAFMGPGEIHAPRQGGLGLDWKLCLESLPIFSPCLFRIYPGRPQANPTATGWDKELLEWAPGVRLGPPRTGSFDQPSSHSKGKIHPYISI